MLCSIIIMFQYLSIFFSKENTCLIFYHLVKEVNNCKTNGYLKKLIKA